MVTDEIQQLKATMAGLVREQADRRALHQRQAVAIKAEAHEYMTKQAQAAERYVQHRRELGRREAGEEEPRPDAVQEMDFEPEGLAESEAEESAPVTPQSFVQPVAPAPPRPAPAPERAPRRARTRADDIEEDDDAFLNNRWRDE
ncbi:hypothetical protein LWP59_16235 [Amycolatopsis acidiphila]|uniref:Uncharacterized protein n=1 Tax=Amycolatopsis acidiphila TaxID=715473 RepID=A0A557ZYU6_9PSEU|nr:hypothetical protein [Amycolatopsis acidiphila]TVT17174.1 hypothetical protein FNH06_32495 [Amycolatopsis acidiphila]UIJ63065.1 hypothetical protein LWP59_16235 [Amycolatopsis acidiphila]GHG65932.1 hypothetical protein GCM10017788_23790 [Amycolatopsis acidiphila]